VLVSRREIFRFPMQVVSRSMLKLYRSTDPRFAKGVESYFPGLTSSVTFQSISPYVVLVQNVGAVQVNAFSLGWLVVRPDGVQTTIYSRFFREHQMPKRVRVGIPAGTTCLASMTSCITPPQFANGRQDLTAGTGDDALNRLRIVSVFVDATIDANGIVVGPDRTRIGAEYVTRRSAAHDQGAVVWKALRDGATADDVESILRRDAQRREAVGDLKIAYAQSRSEEAYTMLALLKDQGIDAVQLRADRMKRFPLDHLRRTN